MINSTGSIPLILPKPEGTELSSVSPLICTIFYNYLRIVCLAHVSGEFRQEAAPALRATVRVYGVEPMQTYQLNRVIAEGVYEFSIQALIDPQAFPGPGELVVNLGSSSVSLTLEAVMHLSHDYNARDALPRAAFVEFIDTFVAEHPGVRPKLLDIGGRRRSGVSNTDSLSKCDVTIFDIVDQAGVDVVGDAHELSRYFTEGYFDFVISVSVFEHLLMPWKVAIEINKVMKADGYCHIHTHQTLGMHDLPWDFWRFSDSAWHGLFNKRTGFEVIRTGLGNFMHILTAGWHPRYLGAENSGGFESSGVIVRKIGQTELEWDVSLRQAIDTHYPVGN